MQLVRGGAPVAAAVAVRLPRLPSFGCVCCGSGWVGVGWGGCAFFYERAEYLPNVEL